MVAQSLFEAEFSDLLEPFDLKGKIAVAVSGGADSVALTLLMKRWALCPIIALTVDHQLRPESGNEAKIVQSWMQTQSIEHHILTWSHPYLTSGLQQKARQARYHLLSEWCLENKVPTLMTAHHLYDQWETFFMRLSKGSGLKGLCGIRPMVKTGFGQLIRPLLTIKPERLVETLKQWKQPYVEDHSNNNLQFLRIRWRQLLPTLAAEGLTPEMLQKTLVQFQATENFLDQQVNLAIQECFCESQGLNLQSFKKLPSEIACRVLKKVVQKIGQASHGLNYSSAQRLYLKLIDPVFKGATAGGCYLKRCQGGWVRVMKEAPRK
jgi:tRNA(Ile)-lysidine synthase